MSSPAYPKDELTLIAAQSELICRSYRHWTGKELCSMSGTAGEKADRLFYLPCIVLSAGIGSDPVLNYGNQAALKLWEMSWDELTQTPGSRTAEAPQREQRSRFLKEVAEKGFIENYEGIRISRSGKRFVIKQAVVWNLIGADGSPRGQAATFSSWAYL